MSTQVELIKMFGGTALLAKRVAKDCVRRPFYFNLIVHQVYLIGVASMPLVMITAASTGMVMALQFGVGLEKFGGKLYVPKIVSLSIVREMGPVFTCLMLAARIGAGIASELGSMTVTQQIDAIRALGTSPIQRIDFDAGLVRTLNSLYMLGVPLDGEPTEGMVAGILRIFQSK